MTVRQGSVVAYTMRAFDADEVNRRRDQFQEHQATASHGIHPHGHDGLTAAPGYVAHIGLTAREGDVLPALVLAVHPSGNAELHVFQRGTDCQWLRNVPTGEGPGTWRPL